MHGRTTWKGKRRKDGTRVLAELEQLPTQTIAPEDVVEVILEGLAHAQGLFEHGTMEERKRVVRAFVEGIRLDAAAGVAETTVKELPEPDLPGAGSSFDLVAGARHEVQARTSERNPEVVRVKFKVRSGALVLVNSQVPDPVTIDRRAPSASSHMPVWGRFPDGGAPSQVALYHSRTCVDCLATVC